MKTGKPNPSDILRRIEEWSMEAGHSDEESLAALRDAGIDPDHFVQSVRRNIERYRSTPEQHPRDRWAVARGFAFAAVAISAVIVAISAASFVTVYYPAAVEAQRQLARAQLISPLLPALASDDRERRAIALKVAQQVDPAFAAETGKQLDLLEASRVAERAREGLIVPYSSRIVAGLQKLRFSQSPEDRQAAIWNDLLPALKEAQKNRDDFVAVAMEYEKVLPLLRVGKPDVFLDSYWGELWILNILLDSKISPVVQAARESAPRATVVEKVFQEHAPALSEEKRKAFEEAIAVYKSSLKE